MFRGKINIIPYNLITASHFIQILTINKFDLILKSTLPPALLLSFKESLRHSWNVASYHLNFIWEINTKFTFLLFQVFKTGIWLPARTMDFKFVQTMSFRFLGNWQYQLKMSNLIITRSSSVGLIPLRQVIENWAERSNTHRRLLWEQHRWFQWDSLFIHHNLCVIFTDGIVINWLKFSADRVFNSVP